MSEVVELIARLRGPAWQTARDLRAEKESDTRQLRSIEEAMNISGQKKLQDHPRSRFSTKKTVPLSLVLKRHSPFARAAALLLGAHALPLLGAIWSENRNHQWRQ